MTDMAMTPDQEQFLASIRRSNAETEKLIEEARKMRAEEVKLRAEEAKLIMEARKYDRERFLAPFLGSFAGLTAAGGLLAAGVALARFFLP